MTGTDKQDWLAGQGRALSLAILALVDVLPAELRAKAWEHIDNALDAGETALLNSEATEPMLEGYEHQAQLFREVR